jgi:hypothetical protein
MAGRGVVLESRILNEIAALELIVTNRGIHRRVVFFG